MGGPGCSTEHGVTYYTASAKDTACTVTQTKKTKKKKAKNKKVEKKKKAAVFCKVGKKDEYGSCQCKLNQCKGPGCSTEFGVTYYMASAKDSFCSASPATVADLDQVVPET